MQRMNNGLHNLVGLIMCSSSQNPDGKDTGLLLYDDRNRMSLAYEKILRSEIPVLVCINHWQFDAYKEKFNEKNLLISENGFEFPLCSLMSAHKKFPKKDILALSCNLTEINRESINKLLKEYRLQPSYDSYCFQLPEGLLENEFAIYTCGLLNKIRISAFAGTASPKLESHLEQMQVFKIKIRKKDIPYFKKAYA